MGAKIVCLNRTSKNIYPQPWLQPGEYDIEMKILDYETAEAKIHLLTPINSSQDVPNKISKFMVNNVKVALFYFTFNDERNIEIVKCLKFYYNKLGIPFFCCSHDSIYYSSILMAYVEEYGEDIIEDCQTLLVIYDDRMHRKEISARSITIKKTDNYFYIKDFEFIKDYTLDYSDEEFKKVITTSTVFVYFDGPSYFGGNTHQEKTLALIASKIKGCTIHVLHKDQNEFFNTTIVSKSLKYIGKQSFKYDFATFTYCEYILGAWQPYMNAAEYPNFSKKRLLTIDILDVIPVKKTIVFYETFEKIVCADGRGFECERSEMPAVSEIGLAATLSVDNFLTITVSVDQPKKVVDNAVIIKFDYFEFSVEIIKNGNLESIGLDKVPLMIGFADGGVQIGEEAAKVKETKNSFVVTNLLTIASHLEDWSEDSDGGFNIKSNDNYCEYIIFDTFRGKRKTTVSFLLALIIKWAATKAETKLGKMPETIVIVADRLRDALKSEFEKACKATRLENIDMQIHQYKIIEVKET